MSTFPTAAASVSIVITHYRAVDDLRRCLAAIRAIPHSNHLEVVVADSDAVPAAEQALHEAGLPLGRYVGFGWNCGYAALVNAGLSCTDRPFVLILNADIEVGVETIHNLHRYLTLNPEVGIVGPAVTHTNGQPQQTAFSFYRPQTILYRRTPLGRTRFGQLELSRFELHAGVDTARRMSAPIDVDWLMGAVLMVRRTAVAEVGLLDEKYFMYFEDVDWCLRFWQAGWHVRYLPLAACRHRWSRASRKGGVAAVFSNKLARRHIRSSLRFFRLYGMSPERPQLSRPVAPLGVTIPAPRREADQPVSGSR